MPEPKRALRAEDALGRLHRDQARLRTRRLQREVAGARWNRLVRIIPVLFDREGRLEVRRLLADPERVLEALGQTAVFALDTAMRLAHGRGFLAGGDLFCYLASGEPIVQLGRAGLVTPEPWPDPVLVRPWPGPPRLLACVVDELPSWVQSSSGRRVVSDERLRRELVGAVGLRPDLFALVDP